jgi:hypothetical protein
MLRNSAGITSSRRSAATSAVSIERESIVSCAMFVSLYVVGRQRPDYLFGKREPCGGRFPALFGCPEVLWTVDWENLNEGEVQCPQGKKYDSGVAAGARD